VRGLHFLENKEIKKFMKGPFNQDSFLAIGNEKYTAR
jgi:hypothetical protein